MKNNTVKSKSGFGAGSASVVLIFAVLCLTIFTLITYISANNYKKLVEAELASVTGYYRADALAVETLDWMLASGAREGINNRGIEVKTEYVEALGADTSYFFCPVNDTRSLYVSVAFNDDTYTILSWRTVDIDAWVTDGGINVWTGE